MFKVGDKVKLCNPSKYLWIGDVIGKVVRVDKILSDSDCVYVQWDVTICIVCGEEDCECKVIRKWYKPSNIKYVVTKNQQLLFNFMD